MAPKKTQKSEIVPDQPHAVDGDGGASPLTLESFAALLDSRLEKHQQALTEAFQAALTTLETKLDNIGTTVENHSLSIRSLERSENAQDLRLSQLEADVKVLKASKDKLAAKVIDLEARSRRNNIRVVGLPESIEDLQHPTAFFAKMLAEVFGNVLGHAPECDRAHRTSAAIPKPGQRPRAVLIRLLRFQDKDKIIRDARARRGTLKFHSHSIFVYEDYPQEVVEERDTYRSVMSVLYERGLKPSLYYPSRLYIKPKEGGKKIHLESVAEAKKYIEGLAE